MSFCGIKIGRILCFVQSMSNIEKSDKSTSNMALFTEQRIDKTLKIHIN